MTMADAPEEKAWRILGKGTRPLPCPLPEDEILEAAKRLGDLDAQAEEVEHEIEGLKTQVKGLNTRLETLTVEMRENARTVRSGAVEKAVDIRTEITTDGTLVQVIREDTNEVIEERDSTPDERQMGLFNSDVAAQVQQAIEGGKKEPPKDGEYDLSGHTPEEQAKIEAESEEYLKKHNPKKHRPEA